MNIGNLRSYRAAIRKKGPSGPLYGIWTANEEQLFSLTLSEKAPLKRFSRADEAPLWLKSLIEETQGFFKDDKNEKFNLDFNRLNFSRLTPFSQRVLRALHQVKKIISYSSLAASAKTSAVRAVATAVGRNPFPLYVPCHRIITASGNLGEYSAPGGSLLKLEILLRENKEYSEKDFRILTETFFANTRGLSPRQSIAKFKLI